MKLKELSQLKRQKLEEVVISELPAVIKMTDFANQKAFMLNKLVREEFKQSYEWYGFTLAKRDNPEVIVDIGIGKNHDNSYAHTGITAEEIAKFQESLPQDTIINGWIHSHGNLNYRHFSGTDEKNHIDVLYYVTSVIKKPLLKKEIPVSNISILVKDSYSNDDLAKGTLSAVTDTPVKEMRLFETIYGGFSFCIVVGDEGWTEQDIYYRETAMLSGKDELTYRHSSIDIVKTGREMTQQDIDDLAKEVKEKLSPPTAYTYTPFWKKGKKGKKGKGKSNSFVDDRYNNSYNGSRYGGYDSASCNETDCGNEIEDGLLPSSIIVQENPSADTKNESGEPEKEKAPGDGSIVNIIVK